MDGQVIPFPGGDPETGEDDAPVTPGQLAQARFQALHTELRSQLSTRSKNEVLQLLAESLYTAGRMGEDIARLEGQLAEAEFVLAAAVHALGGGDWTLTDDLCEFGYLPTAERVEGGIRITVERIDPADDDQEDEDA